VTPRRVEEDGGGKVSDRKGFVGWKLTTSESLLLGPSFSESLGATPLL